MPLKIFGLLLAGLLLVACSDSSNDEATGEANKIWAKLLTQCDDSHFYAGSVFDAGGMLASLGAGRVRSLLEYKKVAFNVVPIPITDAEKLNGFENHVRITMVSDVYREQGGAWRDGPNRQARNANDILTSVIQQAGNDAGQMGTGGAMAFDLMKVKGEWAVARSSTTMSGPLSLGTSYYVVPKILDARMAKYDCEKAAVISPPPTPEEIALGASQKTSAAAKANQQVTTGAARAAAWNAEKALIRDPQKGIAFAKVADNELAKLQLSYDQNGFTTSKTDEITKALVARFPLTPADDQWLVPGTTFGTVLRDQKTASSIYEFRNEHGTKVFTIIIVKIGRASCRERV